MFDFKSVMLSDKEIFDYYFNINKYLNSEYNFTTVFAWRRDFGFSFTVINNCLCIKNKKGVFHFPLGEEKNILGAIDNLKEYAKLNSGVLKFGSLSDGMIEFMRNNNVLESFETKPERDYYDYIYKREKLVSLQGKKLHGKRNHFNFFVQNYNYALTDITDEKACEEKFWHLIDGRSRDPEQEYFATMETFKNRNELGLIGKCLMVDNQIAGIILGQKHHGTGLIQIAKSDISYRGASVALFQLFLANSLMECEYVNFMEDMGIEGLRKAKLSYNPESLLEKYSLVQIK